MSEQVLDRVDARWSWFSWLAAIILLASFFSFEQDFFVSTYVDFVAETDLREEWTSGGNRSRQLGALALAAFGILCFVQRSPRQLQLWDSVSVVALIYGAYIVASTSWSIDAELTQRRLIVLALFATALIGAAKRFSPHSIAEITMIVMTGYLILGLSTEIALGTFKPWSGEHRFAGTTHPNSQAGYMVILCLSAWCVHQRPGAFRGIALPLLVLGLVFLLLTRSRTSLAGFLIAFIIANSVASDKWKYFRVVFVISWIAAGLLIIALLLGIDPERMGPELFNMGRADTNSDETGSLTGRLPLWELMWDYIAENPWWGHGYAAFWTNDNFMTVASEIEWAPSNAHSSYLECLLDLGIFGLIIMVVGIAIILARLAWRCSRALDPAATYAFALFLYALTFSVTEAGLLSPSIITFMLGWSICSQLMFRQPTEKKLPIEHKMPIDGRLPIPT